MYVAAAPEYRARRLDGRLEHEGSMAWEHVHEHFLALHAHEDEAHSQTNLICENLRRAQLISAQLANANPHFAAQASLSGVLAWRRRAAAPIAEGLSQLKLVRAADARVRRSRSKGWGVTRRRAGGCPQRRDEQLAVPQVVNGRWVVKHRAAQALAVPCVQARAKLCSKPFLKLRCRSCTIEQSGTLRERHP